MRLERMLADGLLNPAEGFLQTGTRAGEIEPDKAGSVKLRSIRQAYTGLFKKQGRIGDAQSPAVDPGQVGRFYRTHRQARNLPDGFIDQIPVGAEIIQQISQPGSALCISRPAGDISQRIDMGNNAPQSLSKSISQSFIGDDGEGTVQARQVEGFAGRSQRNRPVGDLRSEGGRGDVFLGWIQYQVRVNLVGAEQAVFAQADLGD